MQRNSLMHHMTRLGEFDDVNSIFCAEPRRSIYRLSEVDNINSTFCAGKLAHA